MKYDNLDSLIEAFAEPKVKPADLAKTLVKVSQSFDERYDCPQGGFTVLWNSTSGIAYYTFPNGQQMPVNVSAAQKDYYVSSNYWRK